MADEDGQVTHAGGSRTLAMDPLWVALGLDNCGCPSLRSLGPKRRPRAAIVTYGCVEAEGKDSGLKLQDKEERSQQTLQYHSVGVPRGWNRPGMM